MEIIAAPAQQQVSEIGIKKPSEKMMKRIIASKLDNNITYFDNTWTIHSLLEKINNLEIEDEKKEELVGSLKEKVYKDYEEAKKTVNEFFDEKSEEPEKEEPEDSEEKSEEPEVSQTKEIEIEIPKTPEVVKDVMGTIFNY